jgi:alpha-L-arabinofuranosidase
MANTKIMVSADRPAGTINPMLYGHFAEHLGHCISDGLWVGEQSSIDNIGGIRRDLIEPLRKIRPPVLRWPGGCFADDYHWEDGIGPRKERPRRVNIWWGKVIEDNCFGTHEFLQLCRLVGAEPYLAGNLGSGTPTEMRQWIEYCNFSQDSTLARRRGENGSPQPFNVRYWGVGNENWGCGGSFCPEDYAAEYRRFANYLHDLGDVPLYLVACGPQDNNLDWTQRFFKKLGGFRRIHGFAAHYYTWNAQAQYGTALEYTTDQWYGMLHKSLGMEKLIVEQRALMDEFDPQRKVGLIVDEWGTWHPPTPGHRKEFLWQQNTLRDALVAGLTLDIFNRQCDKIVMGNIAQTVNVLQALFLTQEDKLVLTPTYHVFDMYQSHQGGRNLPIEVQGDEIGYSMGDQKGSVPRLAGSASLKHGELTLSIVNSHATEPAEALIDLRGGSCRDVEVTTLADKDLKIHNTFDAPEQLVPQTKSVQVNGQWRHTFPAASVTVIRGRVG